MYRTLFLCLVLAVGLAACEDGDVLIENNAPTPTDPSVVILIGGQCRTAGGRIECEDTSRSSPADLLSAVQWELRSSTTGISEDRKQSDPGAEVSFSGLASDTYEVEQTVVGDDGSTAQQVHGDLVISE